MTYYEMTIETKKLTSSFPFGILKIKADTLEDAIEGLQKIMSGEIDKSKLPKTGLDLRLEK